MSTAARRTPRHGPEPAPEGRRRGRPQGHGPGYEAKRNEVIAIATRLFVEHGYSGTTVSRITAETGLGKGALYYYIESKENLLVEIAAQVMVPLIDEIRRISAFEEDVAVRLRMVSEAILVGITEDSQQVWVYEHDYRYLTGVNRVRFRQRRREFENLVLDLVGEGIECGVFRGTDARLLAFQFFNLHKGTIQWYDRRGGWSAGELSREYCRTLFTGFAATAPAFDEIEERVMQLRTVTT